MGDVAVVANPVQELAAAGVVIPAPVLVDAGFDVRLHFGGTDPGLVVELRWRFGDCQIPGWCSGDNQGEISDLVGELGQLGQQGGRGMGKVVMAAGQADFNMDDFPDEAVADNLGRLVEVRKRPLPGSGLPNYVVL